MYAQPGTYDPNIYAHQTVSYDPNLQFVPRLNPIPVPVNLNTGAPTKRDTDADPGASRKRALSEAADEQEPSAKRTRSNVDVVYRLLVPSSRIGKVIGKQGARIRELRESSGAQIKITDPTPQGDDRVIMISSKEDDIVDSCTAAESVLIRVANMVVQNLEIISADPNYLAQIQASSNLLCLLIGRSQAGCLIGKGGLVINEIRETTGANVHILPPEQMPFSSCVSDTDRLVQISGEWSQVQQALKMIAARLRENPPKESIHIKPSYHQLQMRYAQAMYGMQQNLNGGFPNPAAIGGMTINGGFPNPAAMGGMNMNGFQNPAAMGGMGYQVASVPPVPKVTSEMRIPSALMGGIIGRGGANITHVRVLSGCTIKVYDQEQGRTDRSITFEGTAEQVAAAQSLVQAFMNAQ